MPFDQQAPRSQRRAAADLSAAEGDNPVKILRAAETAAKRSGSKDLAIVISEALRSPARPTKIRRRLFSTPVVLTKFSPEEALSLLLDISLSKEQYTVIRGGSKSKGADIYPTYNDVRDAKSCCRPERDSIQVTETMARVPLQSLLNHTAKRIVNLQTECIVADMGRASARSMEANLVCSWGFDGSTGHSDYAQPFISNPTDTTQHDHHVFATTLIPLRLTASSGTILWNNSTPQSVRFCRPIKLEYIKESETLVKTEKASMDSQIADLDNIDILLEDGSSLTIHFSLFMTLIDGKVLSYITGTKSMQTCPLCKATPKYFNDLSNIERGVFEPEPESLQYGISPLHAWIRLFECLLHISYKIGIKKWQARTEYEKREVQNRKKEVQKDFKIKFGVNVDQPKPGGSGTTNDGNTARRAFRDTEAFADILKVDIQLIKNFQVILIALSSQLPIDPIKFGNFSKATAELYVENYSWYPMPATVHKILIHGPQIIMNSLLPVGMLGEDAA